MFVGGRFEIFVNILIAAEKILVRKKIFLFIDKIMHLKT